jgi:integrase/recombinase XerD
MVRCQCPVWAHGRIHGSKPGRWALDTRSLAQAEAKRDRMLAAPKETEPVPLSPKKDDVFPAESGVPVPVDLAVREFLASRRAIKCAMQTIRDYTYSLEDFAEFMRERGAKTLAQVTKTLVSAWVEGGGAYTVRTGNVRRSRVSAMFNWAVKNELIRKSPMGERGRAPRGHARAPFTDDEVTRMLAVLPEVSLQARAMFLVMLYSGMRITDCVFLRRDALNFATRMLTFRTIKSQSRTVITMELHPDACDAIRAADRGGRDFFFLENADYSRVLQAVLDEGDFLAALPFRAQAPLQAARITLKDIFSRAGIQKNERKPHRLCSTFAVKCIRSGIDIFTLKELLGHSSVSITEKSYLAVLKEHRRQIARATAALDFKTPRPVLVVA